MKKIILIVSLLICSNAWSVVKSLTCNNNDGETLYFHLDKRKVRIYLDDGRYKASDGNRYHITQEEELDLEESDFSFSWKYSLRGGRGNYRYKLDRETLKLSTCLNKCIVDYLKSEYYCKIIPYEELELRVKQVIEEDKIRIDNLSKKRVKERKEKLKKRKL